MSQRDYDLVVIGTGAAGLTAAKTAATLGAKVAIVDKLSFFGGDCTWSGCVPSKALIRCATAMHETKHGAKFGVAGVDPEKVTCNWAAVKKHVLDAQKTIYKHDDAPKILQDVGVVTIQNRLASFIDPYTLKLQKVDGGAPRNVDPSEHPDETDEHRDTITADSFIICTGAGPFVPPIPGVKDVPHMTYEDIFTMDEFPASLMVIGGGPIGAELAQAFRRLGSDVTSIDIKMLEREDEDVREIMKAVFKQDGIKFVSGLATKISKGGKGIVVEVTNKTTGLVEEATGTHLLVASGRRPKGLPELNLNAAGVKWKPQGVEVDKNYCTNVKHIYACGDCIAGGMQFTHLAGFQGGVAASRALIGFGPSGVEDSAVPRATFTQPEVATVGLTETQAKAKFGQGRISIMRKNMTEIDRAVCEGATVGFIKIIYDSNRTILGATVVAPTAGEIASELGLAVSKRLPMKDLGMCIHAYPTWSFGLMDMGASVYSQDVAQSSAFACFRRCCSRRLKGNAAAAASTELGDLRPR